MKLRSKSYLTLLKYFQQNYTRNCPKSKEREVYQGTGHTQHQMEPEKKSHMTHNKTINVHENKC